MTNFFKRLLRGLLGEKGQPPSGSDANEPTLGEYIRNLEGAEKPAPTLERRMLETKVGRDSTAHKLSYVSSADPQARIPGHSTQYPGSERKSGKLQLVVGLDFGTAFTKVVIAERRRAYAVPFDGPFAARTTYLLPGILSVSEGGRVHLGETPGSQHHTNLKMRILSGDSNEEVAILAGAFIALVLQHSRAWFLNTHKAIYEGHELDWYVNVGLPTEHYHDQSLVAFYRRVVNAAWLASTQAGPLDRGSLAKCFLDQTGSIGPHAIGLFPEFVAQVNGYVRSPMRKPDLHILMDVGAGTVDVAAFNVFQRDGEDLFPIFAKSVGNRGVHFLHQHRLDGVTPAIGARSIPPFKEGLCDADLARSLGLSLEKLGAIDKPFRQAVFEQFWRTVVEAKKKYPLSRHWNTGVPFFLCGGGARVELYEQLSSAMVRDCNPCPLNRRHLPIPERLEAPGLPSSTYDRLSVAYGLSFDPYDIGEIRRSDEIEDVGSLLGAINPARGQTCPRCKGTGGQHRPCDSCGGTGWLT